MYKLSPVEVKRYNEIHPSGVPCQPDEEACEVCIKIIVDAIRQGFKDAEKETS